MRMPFSQRSLKALQRHLLPILSKQQSQRLSGITIRHDAEAERFNKHEKPRYFCYTTPKSGIIRSSIEIENIPEHVRTAIILHEIGHIVLQAFGSDESEVLVDAFCTTIPGSGYKMLDTLRYTNINGERQTARSVETVSKRFLEELGLDDAQ